MILLHVDRELRRVWVVGQRVHHAVVGFTLIAFGLTLVIHDRRDWRDWFRRDRLL